MLPGRVGPQGTLSSVGPVEVVAYPCEQMPPALPGPSVSQLYKVCHRSCLPGWYPSDDSMLTELVNHRSLVHEGARVWGVLSRPCSTTGGGPGAVPCRHAQGDRCPVGLSFSRSSVSHGFCPSVLKLKTQLNPKMGSADLASSQPLRNPQHLGNPCVLGYVLISSKQLLLPSNRQ